MAFHQLMQIYLFMNVLFCQIVRSIASFLLGALSWCAEMLVGQVSARQNHMCPHAFHTSAGSGRVLVGHWGVVGHHLPGQVHVSRLILSQGFLAEPSGVPAGPSPHIPHVCRAACCPIGCFSVDVQVFPIIFLKRNHHRQIAGVLLTNGKTIHT